MKHAAIPPCRPNASDSTEAPGRRPGDGLGFRGAGQSSCEPSPPSLQDGVDPPAERPTTGSRADAAAATPTPLSSFTLLNIRCLCGKTTPSKVPFLAEMLREGNQLALALTETHLGDHEEAEIKIPGYKPFRQDRKARLKARRDSGGVALYLRDDLAITSEVIFDYSCGVIEAIAVNIELLNLCIIVVYRPPDNPGTVDRPTKPEHRSTITKLLRPHFHHLGMRGVTRGVS